MGRWPGLSRGGADGAPVPGPHTYWRAHHYAGRTAARPTHGGPPQAAHATARGAGAPVVLGPTVVALSAVRRWKGRNANRPQMRAAAVLAEIWGREAGGDLGQGHPSGRPLARGPWHKPYDPCTVFFCILGFLTLSHGTPEGRSPPARELTARVGSTAARTRTDLARDATALRAGRRAGRVWRACISGGCRVDVSRGGCGSR